MKKTLFAIIAGLFFAACGGNPDQASTTEPPPKPKSMLQQAQADDGKGIGEIKHVELNTPLDAAMVARGKAIYELKCAACHRLTAQRVVGPGWKGLTEKRKPEWMMNMIMNVEVMLEEDPTAQALLKECLTRMPNQNLTRQDARDVLEFIFANDGQAVGPE